MKADVIIVGGGVIGWTIALNLAEEGLRPVILEANLKDAAEASGVAAGILGPCVEGIVPGPFLTLANRSIRLHEKRALQFQEELGIDVGFDKCGTLSIAFKNNELEKLKVSALAFKKEKFNSRLLDPSELQEMEPALNTTIKGALEFPNEGQINAQALVQATSILAQKKGVRIFTETSAESWKLKKNKIVGIETNKGFFESEKVIIAAGSWSSQIQNWPLPKQMVKPIRGQLVFTHQKPRLLERVIFRQGNYIVTRRDGTIICGSTVEDVGFLKENTFEGVAAVIEKSTQLVPQLSRQPFKRVTANFRPATPDLNPIVGETHIKNLLVASGHYRNGILLAPITGHLIKQAILGRPLSKDEQIWSPMIPSSPTLS